MWKERWENTPAWCVNLRTVDNHNFYFGKTVLITWNQRVIHPLCQSNWTSLIIGPWLSSRCFFKHGSSSTPCMEFRMVTHMQGSTVFNFKFQCMAVHFSVNKSSENVYFVPNKVYLRGILLRYFIQNKSQLNHIEFMLRLAVTMLCRIRHAEPGFDASKIMILNLRIKNVLAHRKNLKTTNWRKYSMKTDLRR